MRSTWIGVDLGTGGARALALTDDGTRLAGAARRLTSTRWRGPDGSPRHEQDPAAWVAATSAALAEVAAAIDPGAVGGIAVDGTSGSVVLVDDGPDGVFRSPGVMYDDARGAALVDRVRAEGAGLWDRLGYRVGASWALPTLVAMLPEHPGTHVRHQTDVITGWLAGTETATDASTALKTGYDADRGCWPVDVLDALDVDPARLPAVVTPGSRLGVVGSEAAVATGLRVGTPIVAGMTDGCAAQLGTGAVAPGQWNATLGTTLVLKGVTVDRLRDPTGTVYSHRAPQGGWWLPGGASNVGAGVLATMFDPARFDELTAAVDGGPVPVVYPLPGRGERFPLDAADAEGFWLDGDDGGRTRPIDELVGAVGEARAFAAVCEGVAFVERLGFDHLADLGADVTGRRTASGGATSNRWWTGRRASVQGATLAVPATVGVEAAAGMAVLAAAGTGAPGDPDVIGTAARMVHAADEVDPDDDPRLHDRYGCFVQALTERGWW